ncbi:MAG: hypothetical protein JWP67_2840 [Mucilaginibacter sp.]|nr:hypothetical protein [Mucilaginibacter sp.]
MKQIKQILLTAILLFCIAPVFAQGKKHPAKIKQEVTVVKNIPVISNQLNNFMLAASEANVLFTFPEGFKEITVPGNEEYSFDYGMELPGKEFEIWLQVRSQKENYASYERLLSNKNTRLANPDSLYLGYGTALAAAFTGEHDFAVRTLPQRVTALYNADAGKSYLLNLLDMPVTKHYKYALLITLQKAQTGTILAICFANEKGPEFFKNMGLAKNCIKFKP